MVNYNNNGIFPSMYHYGNDFTLCQSAGVDGWFAEQESCINTDFWDMKLWLITKQMENPVSGSAYQALMDEFLNGYYGAAGPYVKQYLDYMHEKAEAYNGAQNFGTHIIGAEWLHVQDIIAGEGFFDAAFEAAGSNETLLRRLRAARSGFDRVVIENFARWTSEALKAELDLPLSRQGFGKRLYAELAEQVALRGDYDGEGAKLLQRYSGYSDTRLALPEALAGIDPVHVYDFTSADFRLDCGDPVVEDAASLTGSAVAYSYEKTGSSARLFLRQRLPSHLHLLRGRHDGACRLHSRQRACGKLRQRAISSTSSSSPCRAFRRTRARFPVRMPLSLAIGACKTLPSSVRSSICRAKRQNSTCPCGSRAT